MTIGSDSMMKAVAYAVYNNLKNLLSIIIMASIFLLILKELYGIKECSFKAAYDSSLFRNRCALVTMTS